MDHTTCRTSTDDMLEAIRQLFQSGDTDEALQLLDDYLAEYPHDTEAELVKVELCLEADCEHTYIGQALTRFARALPNSAQVQALCERRERLVREALAEARKAAKRNYVDSAIERLDQVIALAPEDPGVAMAAARAVFTINPDDLDDDAPGLEGFEYLWSPPDYLSSTSSRLEAGCRYLRRAMECSLPDEPVHVQATRLLVQGYIEQDRIDLALDLLQTLPSQVTNTADWAQQVPIRALTAVVKVALHLLSLGEPERARELLDLCERVAPDLLPVRLARAEYLLQMGRPTRALAAYRAALRHAQPQLTPLPLTAVKQIWEKSQAFQVTCPHCFKRVEPTTLQCPFCEASLRRQALLVDRYNLEKAPQAAVAHTGIAEILAGRGQLDRALTQLDAALRCLPDDHPARKKLGEQADRWKADRNPPQPEHSEALQAIEHWQQSGLTLQALLQIQRACQMPSSGWAEVPLKDRYALARALLDQIHLPTARAVLDTAFTDNPRRKMVGKLRARLVSALEDYAAQRLAEARQALQDGSPETAIQMADGVLELQPDSIAARMLRAEAYLSIGNTVTALNDFHAVRAASGDPDVVRAACLGATRALEACHDFGLARDLLRGLNDDEVMRVLARLDRRQRGEPLIRLQRATDVVMHDTLVREKVRPFYHAFFAVAVRAVSRPSDTSHGDWSRHILTAGFEFVQALAGLRNTVGDPLLALRLISAPCPEIPERGRLTAAFVIRVSAPARDGARRVASGVWSTLKTLLPLTQEYVYAFEPVADEGELDSLLWPFEPASIAEIARREDVPHHDGERYAVYPFTAGSLDLHNLCWTLLRQPVPAMLSIHLLPTNLLAWEQAALDRMMLGAWDRVPVQAVEERVGSAGDQVADWWHDMGQWGPTQANWHLREALRVRAFLLRIHLAASDGASPLLPEMAASAMFGPAAFSDGMSQGGYEVLYPATKAEAEIARHNLRAIDIERWAYSAAPEGATRLRHMVSEREAAIGFRLPIPGPDGVPGMALIDAKPVAPPRGLPAHGTVLGESVMRIGGLPLRITQAADDRRRHTYVVGRTGTGKTTLLKNLALQDIEAGHGVCVVDPHGDLIGDILARIPAQRAGDVILFDPSDQERPIGLNLLEAKDETAKQRVVTEFIGLLIRMYDPHQQGIVGPRFQHNVRHAMLTAMSVEGSTLIEVVRVLTDSHYVKRILPQIKDPLLKRYWTDQIAQTSDFHKSEILDYIVSKFSRFVGDARIRNIIGQRHSTIDYRDIMDNRKVLLVDLSKGKIGPESAQFLGLLLVQGLLITALSRSDRSPDERPDFFLYVDEFQNFATELFATVLSEGRKYGVAVTVANQFLTQLPPDVRAAIFGNMGTIISFRLGMTDAIALAPEMAPVLGVDDLLNLPKYTACVKLLVDGVATRPFTMRTLAGTQPPDLQRAKAIRQASRDMYGRDAAAVTADILARYET